VNGQAEDGSSSKYLDPSKSCVDMFNDKAQRAETIDNIKSIVSIINKEIKKQVN